MGERKSRLFSKSNHSNSGSSESDTSQLTAVFNSASAVVEAQLVRCPRNTLHRIRNLNEAEVITLFTPYVPHAPSSTLAKDMDPFEPLGRALPQRVRHIPYRLDRGMSELHTDFLPASGAIMIVVCVTTTALQHNADAFTVQVEFARAIIKEALGNASIADIPIVLLLANGDASSGQAYADAMQDFPALVTIDDYTTAALKSAVDVLFEE